MTINIKANPAISRDELKALKLIALAASQEDWNYGATECKTPLEALKICEENIKATDNPDDHFYEVFLPDGRRVALVGNGPTSKNNAEYMVVMNPKTALRLINIIEDILR